jgi:hypothetical protein
VYASTFSELNDLKEFKVVRASILEYLETQYGRINATTAMVEFVKWYKKNSTGQCLREFERSEALLRVKEYSLAFSPDMPFELQILDGTE